MRIAALRRHSTGQWMVKLSGKTHYLGTDRTQAERRYRDLIVEHYGTSQALPALGDGITVKELLERYVADQLKHCAADWVKKRQENYLQITRHAIELYGNLPADDFGPKAFKTVREAMAVNSRRYSYVNNLCQKLRAAWKWGVSEEIINIDTYNRLLTVPGLKPGDYGLKEAREVSAVPLQLYEATLPYLTDTMADLVKLLWITGARPNEILTLTPAEVEKDGEYLVYRPRHHKTMKKNKKRAIVFGAEGSAILKKYWPQSATRRFFECYGDSGVIRKAIYRACARAQLPKWHPYQLRHAAVTRIALEHGKEVAKAVAGHSSILMTERYDHSAVERAKKAAG